MTQLQLSQRHGVDRRRPVAVVGSIVLLATVTILVNRVLPGWAFPVCAVVAVGFLYLLARWAGLTSARIGLDHRQLRRAAAVGLIGLGIVAAGIGLALLIPQLRPMFADGRVSALNQDALLWMVAIRIPLGTVLLEEVAFRGVLPALFGGGRHWRWGPVLAASTLFGLWHVLPSLGLRGNAAVGNLPTPLLMGLAVLGAALAGVVLHWWRHTGRGVVASALVHLAVNCGGLLAAWFVLSG